MFSNIGVPGMILIVVIALIIFGPSKLPELGKAFGKTLREFKDATKGLVDDDDATRSSVSRTEPKKAEDNIVKSETTPVQDTAVKPEAAAK